MSSITTGINFDIPTLKEADKVAKEIGISRSRFVQIAVRNQIKLHKKQTIRQFLNTLDERDISILKEEIKGF